MAVRIAINGFGRIGRNFFRACQGNKDIDIVAVNDLTDAKTFAHILKYDSLAGTFEADVKHAEGKLIVNGKEIAVVAKGDPAELPWKDLKVDIAIESTGRFVDRAGAEKHLKAGAKKVLISAPAKDPDATFVLGVNDETYDAARHNARDTLVERSMLAGRFPSDVEAHQENRRDGPKYPSRQHRQLDER